MNVILIDILMAILIFIIVIQIIIRIIRYYYHFPIPAFMIRFIDNPFRRRFIQRPDTLVERMQLEPGMIVIEIGPSKGAYTQTIAEKILPNGTVYAVDIQDSVILLEKGEVSWLNTMMMC